MIDAMKEKILADYQRLSLDDRFSFGCFPGITCFNSCCGDVNIALTPYDILRLKRRLGISSHAFIDRYTVRPYTKDQQLPVVVLRMEEGKPGKPCPFVTAEGCGVYDDRPWPCRMYPVGVASGRTQDDPDGPEFYFLMKEDVCDGFKQDRSWTIREWIASQGVAPYDAMGELFKEINLHRFFQRGGHLKPQQMDMYFTACYDLDRFRSFVFESRFLQLYEVDPAEVARMRSDDEELLRFAFKWLKTCLFSEGTVPLKRETIEAYKQRLGKPA